MKLIRLTDDRYLFDAGSAVTQAEMEAMNAYWQEWWSKNLDYPEAIMFGGSLSPIEYEDRRDSDIEARLKALETIVYGSD